MKNMNQILQQAQKMQEKMAEAQAKLQDIEVTGQAGGGLVEIILDGKVKTRKIKISPSLVVPDEIEILEDLIAAAFNDAHNKLEEKMNAEMSALTGGIPLPPGFKLPF